MGRNRRAIVDAEARFFRKWGVNPHERYVSVRHLDLRIRLYEWGEGPPVLLQHGAFLSGATWAPFARALEGFRTFWLDLPGHGLSDGVDYRGVAFRAHSVQLYRHVLDELGLERASIVGQGLGGMFGLWSALDAPERVERLAVLGTPAIALPGGRVGPAAAGLLSLPVVSPLLLALPSAPLLFGRLLGRAFGGRVGQTAGEEMWDFLYHATRRLDFVQTMASLQRVCARRREPAPGVTLVAEELGRITTPTLFYWGERDPMGGPKLADPALRHMRNAQLEATAGGHCPQLDAPARAARDVAAFLRGHGGATVVRLDRSDT